MGGCWSASRNEKVITANKKKRDEQKSTLPDLNSYKNDDNNKDNKDNKSANNESLISQKISKRNTNENFTNPDILINYLYKGKSEFEQIFKTKDNISNLFDILLEKKSKYSEYDLITSENINLSTKLNEKIGTIFPDTENAEVTMEYLGLDIASDIKEEYEKYFQVIGTILFDLGENIGILIYNIKENSFTAEIIKDKRLYKFNHLSSICNGNNILYISGGDDKNNNSGKAKPIKDFCCIDLFSKNIEELVNLKIARCWHSMLYVPKKYIFIIGGNTLDVELFDIKKGEISIDSKMNEIRNECTLIVMNNSILYTFCGISPDGSFITTVEKCNLRQKERSWSYVNYSTADNTLFEGCYYISHFFSDTSLILFAANEGDKNEFSNILFDIEDEENPTISYYEGENKIIDVVPEKIFYPIENNNAAMIPLITTMAKIYLIDENGKLNIENYQNALKDIV